MASVRQFRKKIKSAKNIAKITRAMQMVAASKMKNAQNLAEKGRTYASELLILSQMLASHLDPSLHSLLAKNEVGKNLIIFVAPEKGLCGGLLTNLAKKFIANFPKLDTDFEFIAVGKKAKNILTKFGVTIIAEFSMGYSKPSYDLVPTITKLIGDKYLAGEVKSVTIFFSEFVNTMAYDPQSKIILPLKFEVVDEAQKEDYRDFLFEPSPKVIVEALLSRYLEVEIYQFLLESYASEQSARMVAMKNATDNAKSLITDLTIKYNNVRQAGITAEINDISSANMIRE